ncbi:helix-turn-helix domain-containing protein [Priestia megaterium]|uniref:helix-turn-helix domain-containing protein n=1 Tax=Priestia megaterium TaxID=1404 RepID=UPI0021ABE249|nr:helix-turn-helix domain-containing protein [Priestia megaterium]MCR8928843.1 helix-turn-helix domain-containing protein [Priestia megaterium]
MLHLDHVIGAKEAAELWNVTEGHMKNLCADGEVVAKKVGNAWVIEKNQPHIAIKQHLKIITGAPFIKSASIFSTYDEYKKVTINYISSFDEYVKENKESKMTNDDYQEYFWTGDKINKILAIEPARILNKFPETDEVEIVLPFNGKVNKVSVKRESLNQYLGYKIEDLSFKDQTWHENFLKDTSSKVQRAKLIKEFS